MRHIFMILGHLSLAAGIIGIFLPILPTTPLVILAAFFYSKGSQRMDNWILNHPRFGPSVREWRSFGVIRPYAKALSVVLMILSIGYSIVFLDFHWLLKATLAAISIGASIFILSKPSTPPVSVERPAVDDAQSGG